MNQSKISFIIVNYATKGLLEKNITNILENWQNSEVILVDNDSPDGSADFVEDMFGKEKRVTLLRTQNNGLSAGFNLGLKEATGEYHIYLGTDAFPTKEALETMITYIKEHPDVGIVSPQLYTRKGIVDMDAHRGFPTPYTALSHYLRLDKLFPKSEIFNKYNLGYKDINTIHEIDACISHFMLVNPTVYTKIGTWDEDYFLYGEDIDFCYRVKQAGFKVIYMGNTRVLHYKGAGIGRDTSKDIENAMNGNFEYASIKNTRVEKGKGKDIKIWMRLNIAKESTKAMRLFYKKHFSSKYNVILTSIVLLGIWLVEKAKLAKILLNYYILRR
jgi:GT2 family glycosyltransferase